MRLRGMLTCVGLTAAAMGVGTLVVLTVGGCGTSGGTSAEPAVSQDGQNANQAQLPLLDQNVPADLQTATFAYG